MAPYKRSNPAQLLRDKQAIVHDMEQRLTPDTEDPEAAQKRISKTGMPRLKGALVIGFKKPNTEA